MDRRDDLASGIGESDILRGEWGDDLATALDETNFSRPQLLKRAAALGLSLPAAAAIFGDVGAHAASEQRKPPNLKGVTIRLGKAPHGANEVALMKRWLRPFEEATGAKVKHTVVPWEQLTSLYPTNFASNTPYDVTYQTSQHLTAFGSRGWLADMTPFIRRAEYRSELRQFSSGAIAPSIYRGKLYGLPFIIGCIVYYVNKDLFAKAGVAVPQTMADLLKAGQQLARNDVWTIFNQTRVQDYGWYVNLIYVHNEGGDIVNSRGVPTINSAPVVRATQWAADISCKARIAPPIGAYDSSGALALWKAGRLALHTDELHVLGQLRQQDVPFQWDIQLPVGAQRRTTFSTTGHWSISAKSRNKEAAWELVKYLSGKRFSTLFNSEYKFVPARKDVDATGGDPLVKRAFKYAATSWDGLNTHPKIDPILDAYTKALEEVSTRCGTDVRARLTEAQAEARRAIG